MRKISRKSAIKWGVITLIIVALGALAYTFLKPEETAPNYLTATVEVGDIENNVMASGKVKALNTVDVGAQVSGEVKRLYVEVGDEVQKGDLIAQIDQVTQKNNLSNEQASLEQSEAALQSAQAELLSKQAALKSAYSDLASRQSELKQAQSDFARLQDLVAIDAISQQEYDTQATSVETAKAAVDVIKKLSAVTSDQREDANQKREEIVAMNPSGFRNAHLKGGRYRASISVKGHTRTFGTYETGGSKPFGLILLSCPSINSARSRFVPSAIKRIRCAPSGIQYSIYFDSIHVATCFYIKVALNKYWFDISFLHVSGAWLHYGDERLRAVDQQFPINQ